MIDTESGYAWSHTGWAFYRQRLAWYTGMAHGPGHMVKALTPFGFEREHVYSLTRGPDRRREPNSLEKKARRPAARSIPVGRAFSLPVLAPREGPPVRGRPELVDTYPIPPVVPARGPSKLGVW